MKISTLLLFSFCISLYQGCGSINPPIKSKKVVKHGLPLDSIKMPSGFQIDVYADKVENARSLCLSPEGVLFVSTRKAGNVYALLDEDKDHVVDKRYLLASGMNMPNGVAYKDGDLYIATVSTIHKIEKVLSKLDAPGTPEVVFDAYPTKEHHGWKYIAFGPDGKLYVPVGAPCNICESEDPVFNTITRINTDGTGMEIVQEGVRNTVGFNWHPATGELWFTDNGRDWMGNDMPACELNRAKEDYQHFGYPYCHQGDMADPKFGDKRSCEEFIAPAQNLGPHVAPLGMEFYKGEMFPAEYKNQIFIAEHGSWNRDDKIGYRITLVRLDAEHKATSYEVFAEGWLQGQNCWGRPVDLEHLPDGSLLVSDDFGDAIYRISYNK